jgi:glycosyltransferase involved in cell wall biosynthesis
MYLIVDAQALQAPEVRLRGIGRYTRELIRALANHRPDWRIEAAINSALPAPDLGALPPTVNVRTFDPLLPFEPSLREANERGFADWLGALGPDTVLEPNVFEGDVIVPRFTRPRPLLAAVVYDLIPLVFHEHYLAGAATRERHGARLRQLEEVDLLLAISDCTRSDVIRLLRWPSSRVATIGGGADHSDARSQPSAEASRRVLDRLRLDRPFVLCVGGVDRRKNLSGALAAYAALPAETRRAHLLVIVCAITAGQRSIVEGEAARLGVLGELRLAGFVNDEELRALYGVCRMMLFPSFYEGLGLPVLEALRAGAPVVASSRSAIPEFAGPLTRLVDPSSPAEMAAAIAETLAEPREAGLEERRRFASQFSWRDTARQAAAALEQGMRARIVSPVRTRPRVAWVSPLPPTPSGISDYSAELLHRLADELDLTLVVSPEATTATTVAKRWPVLRSGQAVAEHRHNPFDLFVYHIGNSDLHIYVLPLMRQQSGLVVLHDVFIGGLALRAHAVGAWPGDLPADVEREGASELAAQLRRGEGDHGRIVTEVSLCRTLVESSEGVVVHNAWAWQQARRHTVSPVFRIPMGVPRARREATAAARVELGLPRTAFVVATLGEVTPAKQIDRLVRAAASLPDRVRGRLLLIVAGDTPPRCAADLSEVARRAGIDARVQLVGRVPIEHLARIGRAADACVQLRFPTRGETSAALLRALSAGSACIVSDAGSLGELPPDVALRVTARSEDVEGLTDALVRLHDDPGLGESLRERAVAFSESTHDLDGAARAYVAAIRLTVLRRLGRDGEWADAASAALAAVPQDRIRPEALERWAQLRVSARGRESTKAPADRR